MLLRAVLLLILFALFPANSAMAQAPNSIEADAIALARQAHVRAVSTWQRREPGLLPYAARIAGGVVARTRDPLGWIAALWISVLAWKRSWGGIWRAPSAAAIATGGNVILVWSWWEKIGLTSSWKTETAWIFISFFVLITTIYIVSAATEWGVRHFKTATS